MSGIFEQLSGAQALRVEGKSAQNIAEFNAQVAEQRAEAEQKRAAFAQKRQAKKGVAVKSELVAKLGEGLISPVAGELIAEQVAELELENLLIGFEGETRARQALTQAELDRLSGKLAKKRGKAAGRAANIQFGVQLATLGVAAGRDGGAASRGAGNQAGSRLLTGFA